MSDRREASMLLTRLPSSAAARHLLPQAGEGKNLGDWIPKFHDR
jgi:hypothetical protein